MKLTSLQLKTQKPEVALAFYTKVFGMILKNKFENGAQVIYILQFPNSKSCLELFYNRQNPNNEDYQEVRLDNYWKYSVFVDNIQQSYHFLKNKKILTNEPYQFGHIGYLMHTKDVENYQIEFIQKTFKQESNATVNTEVSPNSLGKISLGLITIRTKDPVKSINFFQQVLDMKLLVRMHVKRGNGFSLYFLGGKNLTPPNPDLDAIENREWLYHQTEPFIEIQHYWGSQHQDTFTLQANHEKSMGLKGIKFKVENLKDTKQFFNKNNITYSSFFNHLNQKETIQILSPDKQLIIIE